MNVTVEPAATVAPSAGETGCGGGTGVMTNDETGLLTSQFSAGWAGDAEQSI